jgi:hypothetical protein
MGAARLRVASFPVIGEGPSAHEWEAPPEPAYEASASHCWGGDTVRAVADGIEPESSHDPSIPRLTWWDHKGSREWVQAEFDTPQKVSKVAVYWFDDTGHGGGCGLPASWRLLYRSGGEWLPVEASGSFGIEKDRYNEVPFKAVTTSLLRIEVELGEGVSGGILEWRIE